MSSHLIDTLFWSRFLIPTDPVVANAIDFYFYSPVHTPINWKIPPSKDAKFVTFNKRVYEVKKFSEKNYELKDFITGEELCPINYLDVQRFELRILTIVK